MRILCCRCLMQLSRGCKWVIMSTTTIGYAISLTVLAIGSRIRFWYIDQRSRYIHIDQDLSLELKPALWSFIGPLITISMGIFILVGTYRMRRVWVLGGIISALCFFTSGWWLRSLWQSRLLISGDKLTYIVGTEITEFVAGDVIKVRVDYFTFQVRLRWDRVVSVPAIFKSSELLLAFLRSAVIKNRTKQSA